MANAGWARWTTANLAAIASHPAGGAVVLYANRGRTAAQQNVASWTAAKTGLTAAALGATAYSRVFGRRTKDAGDVPVAGGTEPTAATPPEVEAAQRQLKVPQWVIPALTGGVLVANARTGEQQRPAAPHARRKWPVSGSRPFPERRAFPTRRASRVVVTAVSLAPAAAPAGAALAAPGRGDELGTRRGGRERTCTRRWPGVLATVRPTDPSSPQPLRTDVAGGGCGFASSVV